MKKMLLMGYSGAGKTSMHSVIFAAFPAKDINKIGYTVERQQHKFKFMGSLILNLWDCGGQDNFMEQYFLVQKETIFRNVEVLIYVFDVEDKGEKLAKSMEYWERTLKAVKQYSENANIFVLIHKIDKLAHEERKERIEHKRLQIQQEAQRQNVSVKKYFATSIWDETLYQAWSNIVQLLIPNREFIYQTLKSLCETSMCSQAVLFQRSTFLILSHYDEQKKENLLTYEKFANIVKQFKLICGKIGGNIQKMQVHNSLFTGMIMEFTKTQNILIIFRNKTTNSQVVTINASNLGKQFESSKREAMKQIASTS